MRRLPQLVYAVFGSLWLVLGILAVAGLTPRDATDDEVHVLREVGAGLVLVGLMHLWCLRNPERRTPVHLALLVFAALFAGIHWREWFVGARGWASPLINSLPFVALAAMVRGGGSASPQPTREPRARD